jgi:hypothetical protein
MLRQNIKSGLACLALLGMVKSVSRSFAAYLVTSGAISVNGALDFQMFCANSKQYYGFSLANMQKWAVAHFSKLDRQQMTQTLAFEKQGHLKTIPKPGTDVWIFRGISVILDSSSGKAAAHPNGCVGGDAY